MQNKFITALTLIAFTFVTLFSPFPGPTSKVSAQSTEGVVNTGSLRLVTNTSGFSFKKDLMQGDTDPDVKELQKILNSSADTVISTSGSGSPGQEATYFGASTKVAVIKFQEKYKAEILTPSGLTVGTGIVGKATRTKLNFLLGVNTPTLASVGFPQGRASVVTTPAPETGMSVCKFIDLLSGINVVTVEKANNARSSMGCVTVAPVITPTPQGGLSICSFIDLLGTIGILSSDRANSSRSTMGCAVNNLPSVVVKVAGYRGAVSVQSGAQVRLSWHSENTKYCGDGVRMDLPITGSVLLTVNKSTTYPIYCIGINGDSVVDSGTVIVSNKKVATSTIKVLSSSVTPGYDFAIFDVETNVPTEMIITYTNQPTINSSVMTYRSATSTTHSEKITNLVPNSTYYAHVGFIVSDEDSAISEEITFKTLADGSPSELTQRVLSSAGGNGIVTIPGSESLKTESKVTLEAWVKPTSWNTTIGMSNTSDSVIISKGKIGGNIDYALSLDQGKLVYSNKDGSIWTNSAMVPLNKWTHVAVTVNEATSNVSFYVNGIKQPSVTEGARGVFSGSLRINKKNAITEYTASAISSTGGWDDTSATTGGWDSTTLPQMNESDSQITSNIYLGNFYPASCNATSTEGNGFVGLIDDVKVWDIARTADQVKADAATTTAATTTPSAAELATLTVSEEDGLVGHWSFDDGKATDLSNYQNNGAIKGDMEILDDATALSPVLGSPFGMDSLEVSFSESCDADLENSSDEVSGYEITFKGGVQSSTKTGQNTEVVLETCDNPTEDLVKTVKTIGKAPKRDPSYYNTMGSISVTIAPGLFDMKTPAVRDTIEGSAQDYISGPGSEDSMSGSSADSVGIATSWNPQKNSCMKKPEGMMGSYALVGIVALVVIAVVVLVVCTACALAVSTSMPSLATGIATAAGPAIPAFTTTGYLVAGSAAAAAGGYGGGAIDCESGSTGCN